MRAVPARLSDVPAGRPPGGYTPCLEHEHLRAVAPPSPLSLHGDRRAFCNPPLHDRFSHAHFLADFPHAAQNLRLIHNGDILHGIILWSVFAPENICQPDSMFRPAGFTPEAGTVRRRGIAAAPGRGRRTAAIALWFVSRRKSLYARKSTARVPPARRLRAVRSNQIRKISEKLTGISVLLMQGT